MQVFNTVLRIHLAVSKNTKTLEGKATCCPQRKSPNVYEIKSCYFHSQTLPGNCLFVFGIYIYTVKSYIPPIRHIILWICMYIRSIWTEECTYIISKGINKLYCSVFKLDETRFKIYFSMFIGCKSYTFIIYSVFILFRIQTRRNLYSSKYIISKFVTGKNLLLTNWNNLWMYTMQNISNSKLIIF
jgi:hypothetical protein